MFSELSRLSLFVMTRCIRFIRVPTLTWNYVLNFNNADETHEMLKLVYSNAVVTLTGVYKTTSKGYKFIEDAFDAIQLQTPIEMLNDCRK